MTTKTLCTLFAATLLAATSVSAFAQQPPMDANGQKPIEKVDPSDKSKLKAPPEKGGMNAGGTTGQANDPNVPEPLRENYSAPSGGYSSGAHTGNESPTKPGDSSGGKNESEAAKKINPQ
jgi:hypothetical protein